MMNAFAINGSPEKAKGSTGMILMPFLEGMEKAGAKIELAYARDLNIKPCTGEMHCWYQKPGECIHKDAMQEIYPKMKAADVIIIATPVYIPLPGEMQNFINRLCPLILPRLETHDGRTRARFRVDVRIKKFLLISTGGWWEVENFETVTQIVEELALNSGAEFSGALIRPHAFLMKKKDELTDDGMRIIQIVKDTGFEFASTGVISQEKLDAVSRPLVSREELFVKYNRMVD